MLISTPMERNLCVHTVPPFKYVHTHIDTSHCVSITHQMESHDMFSFPWWLMAKEGRGGGSTERRAGRVAECLNSEQWIGGHEGAGQRSSLGEGPSERKRVWKHKLQAHIHFECVIPAKGFHRNESGIMFGCFDVSSVGGQNKEASSHGGMRWRKVKPLAEGRMLCEIPFCCVFWH